MEDIEMEDIQQDYLPVPSNMLAETPSSTQGRNESPVDPTLEPRNSQGLHELNEGLYIIDSIGARVNGMEKPQFHNASEEASNPETEPTSFKEKENIESMNAQYNDGQYEDVDDDPENVENVEDKDAEEEDDEEMEEENEAGWTTRAGRRFTLYKEEIGYNRPKDHHELDEYMRSITGAREVIHRLTTFMPGPHYTLKVGASPLL